MARGERGVPMAVVERILKQKGEQAGVTRVSDKAIRYLKQELEDIALEIAKEAVSGKSWKKDNCKEGRYTISNKTNIQEDVKAL